MYCFYRLPIQHFQEGCCKHNASPTLILPDQGSCGRKPTMEQQIWSTPGRTCTSPGEPKVSILARHRDQRVMNGYDSFPYAAHSIYCIYYTAPVGNSSYKRIFLFSLKCEMQKCIKWKFSTPFVGRCGLKPSHRVHPKIAAWLTWLHKGHPGEAFSGSRGTLSLLDRICLSPAVLLGNAEHDTVSYGYHTPCAKSCSH